MEQEKKKGGATLVDKVKASESLTIEVIKSQPRKKEAEVEKEEEKEADE
jgi:hypothetical protein